MGFGPGVIQFYDKQESSTLLSFWRNIRILRSASQDFNNRQLKQDLNQT